MPKSRRRKLSVRNGSVAREPSKPKNDSQASAPDAESKNKSTDSNTVALITSNSKSKMRPDSSKNTINGDSSSESTVRRSIDKDVTASSSNIDMFNLMFVAEDMANLTVSPNIRIETKENAEISRITRAMTRERTPLRREKYQRQHRFKVRSPKRQGIGTSDVQNKTSNIDKLTFSVGTDAIDWKLESEAEICEIYVLQASIEDERRSDLSSDEMCRICHGVDSLSQEFGQLISACSCRGTVGKVHVKCLERWLTESGKSRCELCGTRYMTRRVHKYGVMKALVKWILSRNAKQLMVDSLGIILMSPLAVLAAWLSGRTLAGLMTTDAYRTPWPLASTFVLACMTLVCYYCWIVSAATRHALGWWVWYRSQYEVRLQLLEEQE